jgi:DNA-binding response OmpR family regulator
MSMKRLLIIDDEVKFGAFVRRAAENLDFEVEVTTNARAFQEAYKRFDPTIIVLDIVMPETDGIELIKWLATIKCAARIVIISGFDPHYAKAAETLVSCAGLKSIVRLRKPVSIAELELALS